MEAVWDFVPMVPLPFGVDYGSEGALGQTLIYSLWLRHPHFVIRSITLLNPVVPVTCCSAFPPGEYG